MKIVKINSYEKGMELETSEIGETCFLVGVKWTENDGGGMDPVGAVHTDRLGGYYQNVLVFKDVKGVQMWDVSHGFVEEGILGCRFEISSYSKEWTYALNAVDYVIKGLKPMDEVPRDMAIECPSCFSKKIGYLEVVEHCFELKKIFQKIGKIEAVAKGDRIFTKRAKQCPICMDCGFEIELFKYERGQV